MATSLQVEPMHKLGYEIEKWGEGLDFGKPATMPKIKDLESGLRWVSGGLGQGLGSVGAPIVGGLAGAAGAAAVTLNPAAAAVGGVVGAFGTNHMILAGEAVRQFEESKVDPLVAAKAAQKIAPAMAALDTLGLAKVLQGPARKVKQGFLRYVGQRLAHGASVEAVTEMAQGVIRESTDAHLSGDLKVQERALAIIEEGIIAGMTGGVPGWRRWHRAVTAVRQRPPCRRHPTGPRGFVRRISGR